MPENVVTLSTQQTFDPLEKAVILITDAMQTDYPSFFHQAYPGADEIRQLKRRLYAKLRGIEDRCIYDGYEICTAQKPNFMPTIPEVIAGALAAQKKYKQAEKNINEALSLPPPPKIAKMPPNIRAAWEGILANASKTEQERHERLKALSAEHEVMLTAHRASGAIRSGNPPKLLCASCGRHGVLSHSLRGDGNWYCSDHFRAMA
jgi:hypothetical protein